MKSRQLQPSRGSTGPARSRVTSPMVIRFWGTRGSIPSPGPETVHYGGNTTCVEVRVGGRLVILDAGTGIRKLGLHLLEEAAGDSVKGLILFSHTHWDHIQGLPFFMPLYRRGNEFTLCGHQGLAKLEKILHGQMDAPFFPVSFSDLPAKITFKEMNGDVFEAHGVFVSRIPLNHPGGAFGYRIGSRGRTMVFMTDNDALGDVVAPARSSVSRGEKKDASERTLSKQDESFVEFCRGADLLIHDAQYTVGEYVQRRTWGHSSIVAAMELGRRANVKQIAFFHHDPEHSDAFIDEMVESGRQWVKDHVCSIKCFAAHEGMEICL